MIVISIGVYKITNKINNKCYIGQSIDIERRWKQHIQCIYNINLKEYFNPLYEDMRLCGINNFDFDIIEFCNKEELLLHETYWINYYNAEYNRTAKWEYQINPKKLNPELVEEIQNILINDKDDLFSYNDLSEIYKVHRDTIEDINKGLSWHNSKLMYPLKERNKNKIKNCIICGKEIKNSKSNMCKSCYCEQNKKNFDNIPIDRDGLKKLIRENSFLSIGKIFGITDNGVRRWCDKYNLPRKTSDIKNITDEDWVNI